MASLPNEILLEIFENLGYWDLRLRVPYVCRRFNMLLKKGVSVTIDSILFRESGDSPTPVVDLKDYKLHPMLLQGVAEELFFTLDNIEQYGEDRCSKWDDGEIPDTRFAQVSSRQIGKATWTHGAESMLLDENLSSPPVKNVSFTWANPDEVCSGKIIESDKPISLGQLVAAISRNWYGSNAERCETKAWWDQGPEPNPILGFVNSLASPYSMDRRLFYVKIEGMLDGCLYVAYQMPRDPNERVPKCYKFRLFGPSANSDTQG